MALRGHLHTHTHDSEKSKNYSEANKKRWADQKYRERMIPKLKFAVDASLKIRQEPWYREKLREAQLLRYSDPEERLKISRQTKGSKNPRWIKDREHFTTLQEWRGKIRGSLKIAKHAIFCNHDMFVEELGYRSTDLRKHIEERFADGMSWKNWGDVWHIDHIRPVSRFEMGTSTSEVNALSNLRPLWARENLVKASRLDCEWKPQ